MQEPLLAISDFSVHFESGTERTTAVKNLSLTIHRGELVGLVGESGSGKSVTSLSILQLIPSPPARFEGHIYFYGGDEPVDLLHTTKEKLQSIRGARIGIIFQEPMSALNPVMKCGDQVAEVLRVHKGMNKKEARAETVNWFQKVKLPDPSGMYDRYPHQLSGGQKQRVMIALAMCCGPDLLVCDEPTTALDVTVQKEILLLIKDLQRSYHMGVLFITHDLGVVSGIADKVAIMYRGEKLEEGNTKSVFAAPRHAYTKALLACRPALHPRGERLPVVADFLDAKTKSNNSKAQDVMTMTSNEVLVAARNITVRFPVRTNLLGKPVSFFTAVDDVSFDIYKGETLGLVGESGCGKTTLGRTLLHLVKADSGSIHIGSKDVTKLDTAAMKTLRKEVQLVFQDPFSALNPRLTIGEAISEPMQVYGMGKETARKQQTAKLLDQVGLPANYANRYPHEFSGGQRQRIVIARALALQPGLLVCDESVSALDVSVQAQVLNLLNDLKRELGLTLLFISHDLSVVRYMSDRIAVMQAGKIVEIGDAEQVYHSPASPYTKQLLEAIPAMNL